MKFNGTTWENVGTPGFSAGGASSTSLAFNGSTPYVAYTDVGNSSKATVMKFSLLIPSLTYSSSFNENNTNNGSVTGSIVATLIGDTFVNSGGTLTENIHYTLTNKPEGLTAVMSVNQNGTIATLTFTGNAVNHLTENSISNLTITFLDGAFTNTADSTQVTNYTNNTGVINFYSIPIIWQNVGSAGFSAGEASNTSLVFNGSTPYVAYRDWGNSSKVTVMKFNGTTWENVGTPGFSAGQASYTSLAFDLNDIPYVAFQDYANSYKTTVMKFNGTTWENVGSAGFSAGIAYNTSLAFNGSTPYVAYMDDGNSYKATVMKFNGTAWENVGTPGFSAGQADYTSLAFNGSTPYVAYRDGGNSNKATVMKFNGTAWENVGTPGFSAGQADKTSLAFNGSTPYVAYGDNGNSNKATVMKFNGTTWENVGTPGFSAGQVDNTSLAFNGSTPYVAYQDWVNGGKATVMKFNGTTWENVGSAGFSEREVNFTSLTFSGSTPYVVYQDVGKSFKATVMKFNGTTWENVGTPGFSAREADFTSLAFDGSTPYVVYGDDGNNNKATVMKFTMIFSPVLTTKEASSVTTTKATLNGDVTNTGGVNPTVGFEYGLDTEYGTTIEYGTIGAQSFSMNISNLTCGGNIYHYRAYATNGAGTGYGDDKTFTTMDCTNITTSLFSSIPNEDGWVIDGAVYSSAVADDGTVYIGGDFTTINGEDRNRIASFNPDGTLTSFNPIGPDSTVFSLALSLDQSILYVGGYFTNIGEVPRKYLASFKTIDGTLTDFNPNLTPGGGGRVAQLIVSPDGHTLYASGGFGMVGEVIKSHLASWDITIPLTPVLKDFTVGEIDGGVAAMALSPDGNSLYFGGNFSHVNGSPRNRLASINTSDGSITDFDPNIDNTVTGITFSPDGSVLYTIGWFSLIGDEEIPRKSFASFNTSDGTLTDFSPNPDGEASQGDHMITVSPDGKTLFIGGGYSQISYMERNNLASYNTSNNVLTDFNPNIGGYVYTLNFSPNANKLYVGGNFSSVGGDDSKQKFISFSKVTLDSISITHTADKLSYTVGESLDITGLEVTGTYSDDSTKVLNITTNDITGFDSGTPVVGQELTITYEDKTTTYMVDITAAVVETCSDNIQNQNETGIDEGGVCAPSTSSSPHHSVGGYLPGYGPRASFTPVVTPPTPDSTSSPQATTTFTKNLKYQQTDEEVKLLQIYLNTHGFPVSLTGVGSLGHETNYFGQKTKQALIKFQKAHNLPATGFFGPLTRALVNQ